MFTNFACSFSMNINFVHYTKFYNDKIDLRIRLFEVFNHRYIYYGEEVLQKEKDFYLQLQQSIEKKASKLKSGPEWATYNQFNKLLNRITENL